MVDAEADIAVVGADVIDTIGDHLAEVLVLEVVRIDLDRLAFGSVIATGVLEFADQLLLLRVDRDHRQLRRLARLGAGVDMLELRIAIRMVAAILRLAVDVPTILQLLLSCPRLSWTPLCPRS